MIRWLAASFIRRRPAPAAPSLSWRCHVCGQQRPDALIAVHSRVFPVVARGPVWLQENVRYCSDRDACREAAKTYSHLGAGQACRGFPVLPDLRRRS